MKKILSIAGLAALVILQAAFAWNARLSWRARAVAQTPGEKIRLLRQADAVFPWNGAVAAELGRVYFEQGAEAMADPASRDPLFRRSIDCYLRSLRLNPGSAATHFGLGQALLYASFTGPAAPLGFLDEYKRAAELTGHDSQIRYEAGKVLFGQWDRLRPEERDFVSGLLKSSIAGKGEERVLDLLEAWYLAGHDAGLIDRILPEEPEALETYARFLGERSLSLEDRQSALSRAEALDVVRAKAEIEKSRRAAESFMTGEAIFRAGQALDALGSVRFYQDLTGRELVDPKEVKGLKRVARRLRAMNWIEEKRSLDDPDEIIASYLDAEDNAAALGEFETFLKERSLLDANAAETPFKSLKILAFRLGLDYELGRYADITGVEGLLAPGSTVLAPSGKASYVRILGLIAAADLKLGSVLEAEAFYRKARDLDHGNLEVLMGLERCYGRLADEAKAAEVRSAIARLTTPEETDLGGQTVAKGQTVKIYLTTTGGRRTFRLEFGSPATETDLLVSVFLDGRVVWEKYGDTGVAEFAGDLKPGLARLEITAVNAPVNLKRLSMAVAAPH